MSVDKVYAVPETPAADQFTFNADLCIGCNRCVDICQVDVFLPNPEKGKPPVALYAGECWYCGSCVVECPKKGAIKLRHPLMNQVHWEPRYIQQK